MILSQTCRYGIRAVLYLVSREGWDGNYISISTISRELGISFHFLTKILQQLTQAGIMKSYRGPGGGVALAQDPSDLTLCDIVVTLEGAELFDTCVLGLGACSSDNPCPLHAEWEKTRENLNHLFGSTNLRQFAEQIQDANLRLSD